MANQSSNWYVAIENEVIIVGTADQCTSYLLSQLVDGSYDMYCRRHDWLPKDPADLDEKWVEQHIEWLTRDFPEMHLDGRMDELPDKMPSDKQAIY